MELRIAFVGMPQQAVGAFAAEIDGVGKITTVWPTFPVDAEYLLGHGCNAAVVDGSKEVARALEAAQALSARMEVVLLGRQAGADALRAAMRAGCTDLVDPWQDRAKLREVLSEIGQRARDRQPEGRLLSVLGCQGGIGATTVVVALAHILAADPRRKVVAADMDVTSGDLMAALDMTAPTTTADLLAQADHLDVDKIKRIVQRHTGGFWVLPQPPEDLDSVSMTVEQTSDLVGLLTRAFTDVVVDMGSALGETSRRVALSSDNIVLVTTQEVPPLRKAARRLAILRELGVGADRVHLVVNRFQPKRFPRLEEISLQLRHPVIGTIANDYATVNEALHAGATVVEASPKSAVAQDLQVLKARLLGEVEPKVKKGWWPGG